MSNNTNTYVCPHCGHKYTLGVNGTVLGCDPCMNISRNAVDNTIINTWDGEDELTDMEKS